MRILFVTQYYLPEIGAPQNRLSGLSEHMKKNGAEVVVLTAMPNYPRMRIYDGYRGRFFFKEEINGIPVYRSWIYSRSSRGILSRLLNYFSFVFTSFVISFRIRGKFDFVFCESPPLFLGMSAVLISRIKKAKFIFNVSDLWPESAVKLGLVKNKFLLNLSYRLEKWLYRNAIFVTGQTKGICDNIVSRYPQCHVHWLPNGIDEDRFVPGMNTDWRKRNGFNDADFLILYAGIHGHAQGLQCVLEAASIIRDKTHVKFLFLGDGPEKPELQQMSARLDLKNVSFFDSVGRQIMPEIISSVNASVIPLKALDLFKGAIPSKIFESLAMEKPILLGVDGEAKALFITEARAGLFFEPGNSSDLAKKINEMINDRERATEMGKRGRQFVMKNFERGAITAELLRKMESAGQYRY